MRHRATPSAVAWLILAANCQSVTPLLDGDLVELTHSAPYAVTTGRMVREGFLTGTTVNGSSRFKTPLVSPVCVMMVRRGYSTCEIEKVQL
jgi:hypothetical protein